MEKLFYKDVHMTAFEGIVTECSFDKKSGCYKVILDRTAFFPEEGGQLADKGILDGQEVVDVRITHNRECQNASGDTICHLVSQEIPVGKKVTGQVDWAQRFDFMQQHSGEHIISGLVHKHYGYDNVGFHLGLTEVTLDFNGDLSLRQLREIEAEANAAVWQNLPIQISFPSKEELDKLEYRSKIELTGAIRIVEIPGIDMCACCAPHVALTGEIGLIKITGVQSHRGGIRVNILCGARAVADYTEKQNSVSDISVLLSAKQAEVAEAVNRLKEESSRQKQQNNALQAKLLELQLASLPSPSESANAILTTGEMDNVAMRNAVNSLVSQYSGYCAVFSGSDETGYHFIAGSAEKDCRELATELRQTFQAKGGGTAPMIQGSLQASAADIMAFFQS